MKKNVFAIVLLLFIVKQPYLFAQTVMQESLKDRFREAGGLNVNTSAMGTIYGFDNSTSGVLGSTYLTEEWTKANIKFYPRVIQTLKGSVKLDSVVGVMSRINLKQHFVEIKVDNQNKYIDADWIQSVSFPLKTFVNVRDFNFEKLNKGFIEVISTGKYGLYLWHQISIKQPDYSPALNTGSKDAKVIHDIKTLLAFDKQLYILSGKKTFEEILGSKIEAVAKYVKENDLSFKDKELDKLISLISYLNQHY